MIKYVTKQIQDPFNNRLVSISGYAYDGYYALFDSYVSAMAHSMGMWDEYCAYHRTKA